MGEMVELDPHYTTIGRGLTATVRINDEGISRTHAAVTVDRGVYYLSDAGSTNGTFANGERVDRYPLREGDKIQLGAASVLRFTFNEDSDDIAGKQKRKQEHTKYKLQNEGNTTRSNKSDLLDSLLNIRWICCGCNPTS